MSERGVFAVYIIASTCGHIKVGVAKDVLNRLAQLQGANPHLLSVSYVWRATKRIIAEQVEARTHELLAGTRVRGEWFLCSCNEAAAAIGKAIVYVRNKRGNLAYQPHLKCAKKFGRRANG
jgi:Meiotically up-regulated gene 113